MSLSVSRLLIEKKAVQIQHEKPFTWTSGIISPVYCDCRKLISHVDVREKIIQGFQTVIEKKALKPDIIAGTATAAIPWAAFLAERMDMPMAYVRPEPKKHGTGKQVEGDIGKGSRVLIIEDLISTGGSSLKSADALKKECDAHIVGVLSIVSYELTAAIDAFSDGGIARMSLATFPELVEELSVSVSQKKKLISFTRQPQAWAKKYLS